MNSTRTLWITIGTAALLTTALWIGGLVYAVNDVINPKPAPYEGTASPAQPEEENKTTIDIVALGDSLTVGTGDVSGKGYVQNVREKLAAVTKKQVNLIGNYGINGYKTDQLLNDLQKANGVPYGIEKADVVLLTIGGNDLFAVGQDVMNSQTNELDANKVRERLPEPMNRLEQILTRLAQLNPKAKIVYVGVYNPFYDLPEMRPASVHVQEWNDRAFDVANRFPNMVYVPTFDLFQLQFAKYMYSDHFHPNQEGYVRIADRVVQALE
ncbi:GDSL-type esterase/lipase family protein [Paenibacillus flagellatus]|uniref:Lipase n=1 Tax=Paenibacillus flagellatus TaxID=2211139 RepID=A0A2V5KAE8_9BACL|nr:GDSL-type esterase/lipase family protein [Paenibacillus flagellatus]PYI54833.1 lipase [Paenibacillus flagellatus]